VINDSIKTSLGSDIVDPFARRRVVTLDVTLAARFGATSPVAKVTDYAEVDDPPFEGVKGNTEGNDPPFGTPSG